VYAILHNLVVTPVLKSRHPPDISKLKTVQKMTPGTVLMTNSAGNKWQGGRGRKVISLQRSDQRFEFLVTKCALLCLKSFPKVESLGSKNRAISRKSSDWERLARHISVFDYKNVAAVLSVAMRNGSSPSAMVMKLSNAIHGIYTPHPTPSQFDIDLAYLTQSIGGPRLLFAMNRSFNLPSYRSLMRRQTIPVLVPSLFSPSFLEVNANVEHFFCDHQQPNTSTCGHSLLVDGVALEEKCRYLRSSDSIVGVCREHGSALDLRVRSQESLADAEDALHGENPRAHYASEATVAAVAPFRNSSYSAIPVALSGSCKAETGEGMALWLRELIRAWRENEDGEKRHGPLWSVATDGESTMRSCRFQVCMSQELAPLSPLYPMLRYLPGLNLFTGLNNVTMTCDPKHIFKSTYELYILKLKG